MTGVRPGMARLLVQAVLFQTAHMQAVRPSLMTLSALYPGAAHSAGSLPQGASVSAMLESTSALLDRRMQQRQVVHQSMGSHEGQPCQDAGHCSNIHSNLQARPMAEFVA